VGSVLANRSSFGVFDMAGNVWEWVDEPYASVPDGNQVARGGSFDFLKDMAYRLIGDPELPTMRASVGVRCAASEVADSPNTDVILFDDFSDQASGWPELKQEGVWRGYHPPDFYHVEATGQNQVATAFFGSDATDVSMEARVFVDIVETDEGNFRYGLLLRQTSDRQFYAFTVSLREGTWAVLKATADGLQTLADGSVDTLAGWSVEEADTLTVIANQDTFTFFINGRLITTVVDADYAPGDFGFYVETFDETRAHVHFDELTILQIEGEPLTLAAANANEEVTPETAEPTQEVPAAEPTAEPTQAGETAVPVDTPTPTTEPTPTTTPTPTPIPVPDDMALIPAGTFLMGSDAGEPNERPEHEVTLDAFLLDLFEVSNEDYRVCVTAEVCTQTGLANSFRRIGYRNEPEFANYPVIGVTWDQATTYCEWFDKRLPTEAEWEYAASGPDNFTWPWGNEFDPALSAASSEDTQPVDAFPEGVSPFGIFNMAGNVNEWVQDRFDANFYANSPAENPVNLEGSSNIFRGGSFDNTNGVFMTTSRRYTRPASTFDVDIGFRCAQDVP
jgi:formylglycine-generating enzyme required for sulfatase activity